MQNDLGTVEAGKLADLLVLDADPLANISNIRKLRTVSSPPERRSRFDRRIRRVRHLQSNPLTDNPVG